MIMSAWPNSSKAFSSPYHYQQTDGQNPFDYFASVHRSIIPDLLGQLSSGEGNRKSGDEFNVTDYYDLDNNYVDGGDDGSGGNEGGYTLGELTTSDMRFSLSVTTENYGGGGGGEFVGSVGDDPEFWMFFDEKYLRHSLGWTITLVVAYLLILIIGIIGNCMVILVVLLRPQMRTVTNLFIMNLAVADLFVIVFCVPATLLANVLIPWIMGSFMCKAVAYVQGVSVCASAYSLAAISLDRSKAIFARMERPRGLSRTQALITIIFIWVLSMLMTIPWIVVFDVIKSDKDGLTYCLEIWGNEQHGKVYFLSLAFTCFLFPLLLISISNIVIFCHVSRRKVPQEAADSAGRIKRLHRKTRHEVRKMLSIVTLAFLVSWLPLYTIAFRAKFSSDIGEWEANLLAILIPFAQWLGSWNSSINPVLYAFLNSKFRESFASFLPAWIPFLKRKPRTAFLTTGTIVGTTASPSYTTVYTARSSGRSSGNSRRYHYHKTRTLLVSNLRSNMITSTTTQLPQITCPAPPPSPNYPTITDL